MSTELTHPEQPPGDPRSFLNERERPAYEDFIESRKPHVGAELAGRMFDHFLNGKTCSEIQRVFSECSFGSIVVARIEYGWDLARKEHFEKLMNMASTRAMRAQLEAVDFLFDMFQVTHLVNRDKFAKFMKSRDANDLAGALQIDNIKQYRDLVNAMLILVGRPNQIHETKGQHHHTHEQLASSVPAIPVQALGEGDFLAQSAARIRAEQEIEIRTRSQSDAKRTAKKPQKVEKEDDE